MGKSLQHAAMALPRGYLFGLTLSTAGSSTTFTTAAGEAVDDTFVDLMTLGSSLAKTTGSWAVGAATGSLDTGTIAASTWYHVYLIKRVDTGVVDVLTSLSASSPTMPTNYTIKRRIGSMLTNGSSQWVKFLQNGDEFLWDAGVAILTAVATSSTSYLQNMTVPPGVAVNVLFYGRTDWGSGAASTLFSCPDGSDQAVAGNIASMVLTASNAYGANYNIRSDTSGRIRIRSSGTGCTITVTTNGWVDTRGKLF